MQLDLYPYYATPHQNCLNALTAACEVLLADGWEVEVWRNAILHGKHQVLMRGWYVEFTRPCMIRYPDGSVVTRPAVAGARQDCLGHAADTAFKYACRLKARAAAEGWVLL